MRMNEEQLKNMLVECYTYHLKKARELTRKEKFATIQEGWEAGKHDGAANAYSTIMLMCFGGKETFDIWNMARKWCEAGEDPDE